jgi:hypothetical protein
MRRIMFSGLVRRIVARRARKKEKYICDFRFKKKAKTRICSKTPEVQETIERIWNKEAERSAPGDADKPRT